MKVKDLNDVGRIDPRDAVEMPPPGAGGTTPDALRRVADTIDGTLSVLRRRMSGIDCPIPLPWPELGAVLSAGGAGLWPGLHVVVGKTGGGKTQFALQAALHAAQQGIAVAYCGLEMGTDEITTRMLALLAGAGTHWSPLFHGKHTATSVGCVSQQNVDKLRGLPIHIDAARPYGWHASRIGEVAQAIPRRPGQPVLLVVDYLQLVASDPGQRQELRERIAQASAFARAAAIEHNAAVMMISSTSRQNYAAIGGKDGEDRPARTALGQGDPGRFIGLGKESGEIEFNADSVTVLCPEPWPDDKPPADGTTYHLAVAKVRAGRAQWVTLRFDGTCFGSAADTAPNKWDSKS